MSPRSSHRSGQAGTWYLLAGVVLTGSVGLVLRGGDVDGGEELGLTDRPAAAEVRAQEPRSLRAPVALAVEPVDAYEVLASHWGERWDEVRLQLEAQGKLGDSLPEVLPWDAVAGVHQQVLTVTSDGERDRLYRRLMTWPEMEYDDDPNQPLAGYGQLTPDSLAAFLELPELAALDQDQVYLVEQRFADMNARLDGMIRSYMEGLGQVVAHRFRTDTIERAPVALPEDDARFTGRPSFHGGSITAGGWQTHVQLYEDEHPDLAAIKRQIIELRRQRQAELLGYASELLAG